MQWQIVLQLRLQISVSGPWPSTNKRGEPRLVGYRSFLFNLQLEKALNPRWDFERQSEYACLEQECSCPLPLLLCLLLTHTLCIYFVKIIRILGSLALFKLPGLILPSCWRIHWIAHQNHTSLACQFSSQFTSWCFGQCGPKCQSKSVCSGEPAVRLLSSLECHGLSLITDSLTQCRS